MAHVNRSELFSYLQNKAIHYKQLRNIRPSVEASRPAFELPKKQTRLEEKQLDNKNKVLLKNLMTIVQAKNSYLAEKGYYSVTPQPVRSARVHKDLLERQRQITIENSRMQARLNSTRAQIGCVDDWNKSFEKTTNLKNRISCGRSTSITVNPEICEPIRSLMRERSGSGKVVVNESELEKIFLSGAPKKERY